MGNRNSSEGAKGAGQDVIKQTETSSHQLYQYIDLKGGGKLVTAFRRAQALKDFTDVDKIIENELPGFLYNNGNAKLVPVADLVRIRRDSRQKNSSNSRKIEHSWKLCEWKKHSRSKSTSKVGLMNESFTLETLQASSICYEYRQMCWDINQLGAVGESILHLCFLNATKVHYDLAKKLLTSYPNMINDIYICDEYYGENCLHMAIVNENLEMVHFLCKKGINIHERAFGAFFCPEDQLDSREDDEEGKETIELRAETNYKSNTYWGEYPLSFAACLGQEDAVKYLLRRKACPNKQDTNGNTVLHMVVIHDRSDMYDLILDYGCCCDCGCTEAKSDIKNVQGFTPLTLAAKLAKKEMFQHIINRGSKVFWEYGGVSCAAFSLKDLETTDSKGHILENSALNVIIHEDSRKHLELIDGIIHEILDHKWQNGCRFRFFQLLLLYIIYLIIIGCALALKPLHPDCKDSSSGNATAVNASLILNGTVKCDPCYLKNSISDSTEQMTLRRVKAALLLYKTRQLSHAETAHVSFFYAEFGPFIFLMRGILEILANVWAVSFLVLLVFEMVMQGFKTVAFGLVNNPIRGLFALSCAIVPCCLIARFMCLVVLEDHLVVISLVLAWPYALMFCKGFSLTGPYVVMIYQMLRRDFIIFFIIYMIFVIGFSQAMFLVMLGYADSTVKENLFSRWFSSGLGLIVMSLGEFGDLHTQLMDSNSPFKIIGLIMFFAFMILGALLIVNMLIAMMGNTYLAVSETEKEWTRQWARIVLGIERMLTPKQKIKLKTKYSEPLETAKDELYLIMKLRRPLKK